MCRNGIDFPAAQSAVNSGFRPARQTVDFAGNYPGKNRVGVVVQIRGTAEKGSCYRNCCIGAFDFDSAKHFAKVSPASGLACRNSASQHEARRAAVFAASADWHGSNCHSEPDSRRDVRYWDSGNCPASDLKDAPGRCFREMRNALVPVLKGCRGLQSIPSNQQNAAGSPSAYYDLDRIARGDCRAPGFQPGNELTRDGFPDGLQH